MRRLLAAGLLGPALACSTPAKRAFTADDLGPPAPAIAAARPGKTGRGGAARAVGGPGAPGLVILPDGRLARLDEPASLAPALGRFAGALAAARPGDAGAEARAWDAVLAAVDGALAGPDLPRLELVRASAALETELAVARELHSTLAGGLDVAVAGRLAALEERLARPPPPRATPAIRRKLVFPVEPAVVTSFFGPRADPFDGRHRWHHGVDLQAETGQAVRCAAAGTVVAAGWAGGHGRRVEVAHDDGLVTGYSHLSALLVEPGMDVEAGQAIGLAGATGRATGPHLHFEVWRDGEAEDPLDALGDAVPVEVRAAAPLR